VYSVVRSVLKRRCENCSNAVRRSEESRLHLGNEVSECM
jgi:hypothetical protein